ncbi:uncharacterized protein HaLaN_24944, partial [Haematococcus lacustris]
MFSLQALHVGQNRINEANDMERLSCLTNLVEVSLVNNPITRRQGYRTLLIAKCSRLYAADGQVISLEEREYAEGLLSQQQPSQSGLEVAGKVAVRMTNLDFAGLAAAVGQYSQAPDTESFDTRTAWFLSSHVDASNGAAMLNGQPVVGGMPRNL